MDERAWEALRDGAVAARLAGRAVARVRGEGPLDFLEDVTTQAVAGLRPGEGTLACLLDANGHVLAEFRVLALADGSVLLDGEEACRAPFADDLARVAPLAGCEVVDESERWETIAVRGPAAESALGRVLPREEHAFDHAGDAFYVRVDWGPPGYDVLLPAGMPLPVPEEIGPGTLEAARIAAGRPRFGIDVTPDLFVNETPLLDRAVSFTKGCYPGQESVARIHNLGRVRRRLVGLRVSGDAPEAGAPLTAWDREVGRVTSAAVTPAGGVAIALLRSEVADGDTVDAAGRPAVVRPLG